MYCCALQQLYLLATLKAVFVATAEAAVSSTKLLYMACCGDSSLYLFNFILKKKTKNKNEKQKIKSKQQDAIKY